MAAATAAPGSLVRLLLLLAFMAAACTRSSEGKIPMATLKQIGRVNRGGARVGVVVPLPIEMNPLLQSRSFVPDERFPFLDFAGRRFRFGTIEKKRVIVVMTGLGMLNAGLTTQLLLALFEVEGVVHYGIAGNANPDLQIGDVVVPRYWAHTGLWVWQRYGDGPNDELPLESAGDYTRELGHLRFSDFSNNATRSGNTLNRAWYQPEEIFPVDGVPEQRQHAFWVPAAAAYFALSKKLEHHNTTVQLNLQYSPPPHATMQTARLLPRVAPPVDHGTVLRKGGAFFVQTKTSAGFSIRAGPPIAMAAAPWWKETAMLVIDMQNDFILPGGPMHVAGGEAIVPSVIRAVSAARERGVFVVWVVREHDPWGRDVEVFRRHLYADGKGPTSKGSKGAELVDGLVIEEGDYKLIKSRFSAFFATHLHSLLQTSGIKELVVVGVQTPNCIRQTVFDAVALDYQQVTVITDATAAASPEVHIANILDMKNVGVATMTLQEWCGSKA